MPTSCFPAGHLRQLTRGASPEAIAKATTERCFAEADINHDGKLSFEEFRRYVAWGVGSQLLGLNLSFWGDGVVAGDRSWYQWMQSKPPSTIASEDFETFSSHHYQPKMYYYSY